MNLPQYADVAGQLTGAATLSSTATTSVIAAVTGTCLGIDKVTLTNPNTSSAAQITLYGGTATVYGPVCCAASGGGADISFHPLAPLVLASGAALIAKSDVAGSALVSAKARMLKPAS